MNYSDFTKRILKLIKEDKDLIRKISIFAILLGLLELTIPIGVQVIINRVYQTLLLDSVVLVISAVAVFLIFQVFYLLLRFNLAEYLQRRIVSRISISITDDLLKTDRKHLDKIKFFESFSLSKNISYFLTDGLNLILAFTFGALIVLFYHPFFAVLTVLTAGLYVLILYSFHNRCSVTAINESKSKYNLAEAIINSKEQDLDKLEEIKALTSSFLTYRKKHFSLLKLQYILILIVYIMSQVALLGFGSYLVLKGNLSVGQLVASELIFSVVLISIAKSIKFLEAYYDTYANIEKVSFIRNFKNFDSPYLKSQSANKYYRWSLALLFSLPFLLLLLPWRQTAYGHGQLTTLNPEERTQEISSFVDGRISKWYVKEGEEVEKDQPIVELVDNDPNYLERLRLDRDASFQKYEAQKIAATTALINLKRQKDLYKEGLTSRVKFEKSKIEYHKLLSKEAEAASSLAKKETMLSRQERRIVLAPSRGVIQQLYSGNTSSIIKKGTKLAVFVPDTKERAIEVYVKGQDLPLIYPGREALIEFDGFPAFQFSGWPSIGIGLFKATVSSVDSTVSKNGKFRVIIVPKNDEAWPKSSILRRGAKAISWIQLNEVKLGYELWRQFNGFPSLPGEKEIKEYEKGKK